MLGLSEVSGGFPREALLLLPPRSGHMLVGKMESHEDPQDPQLPSGDGFSCWAKLRGPTQDQKHHVSTIISIMILLLKHVVHPDTYLFVGMVPLRASLPCVSFFLPACLFDQGNGTIATSTFFCYWVAYSGDLKCPSGHYLLSSR